MKRRPAAPEALLAQLAAAQLRRVRATVTAAPPEGRLLEFADGRRLLDFCSNDYLGLARHPALAAALGECARTRGAGSGAAHLVSGHGHEHARLEEELARFTGRERALLFSTGYMANLAVLTLLAGRGERVLLDRLSHASLLDGARLAGARLLRYRHADAADAAARLALAGERAALVATDGVFSMDGDLAPLPQLAASALAHECWLAVDDAHGLGVLGAHGGGTLEHFRLDAQAVPLLIGTLGKAFGSFGAFVAGDGALIELLLQKARSYIYTTALPQPVAAATRAALALVRSEGWRRARLRALSARFVQQAQAAQLPLLPSSTPIQPLLLGSAAAAVSAQQQLAQAGFWVVAIRPPTVPPGSARLRITLAATHSEADIDALVAALVPLCHTAPRAAAR
jgi:8-amino-7-oxononanoate synthase